MKKSEKEQENDNKQLTGGNDEVVDGEEGLAVLLQTAQLHPTRVQNAAPKVERSHNGRRLLVNLLHGFERD